MNKVIYSFCHTNALPWKSVLDLLTANYCICEINQLEKEAYLYGFQHISCGNSMKNAKPISLISSNILYMQQPFPQMLYFFTDHIFKTPKAKLIKYILIQTANLFTCLCVYVFLLLLLFRMLYSSITGKDKFEMVTVVIT